MLFGCLVFFGFLACPTDQAPIPRIKENISWKCADDKTVKGVLGENLTLISLVNTVERCYFVFTHQDANYQCCYAEKDRNDCDAFDYDPRCLTSNKYAVKIDSLGGSAVNTCNLTIESVNSASDGNYQSFSNLGQAIQRCNIASASKRGTMERCVGDTLNPMNTCFTTVNKKTKGMMTCSIHDHYDGDNDKDNMFLTRLNMFW